MSDERLRELERRFLNSGDVRDEAAWLKARVRGGELSQANVELAGHLGRAGARLAIVELGGTPVENPSPKPGSPGLMPGAWGWHKDLLTERPTPVRMAIAAAQLVSRHEPDTAVLRESAEWWALCPCPMHEEFAHAAWSEQPRGSSASGAALAAAWINPVIWWDGFALALHRAAEVASEAAVRSAIADEVGAWLLGYSDPVRERVEARKGEVVTKSPTPRRVVDHFQAGLLTGLERDHLLIEAVGRGALSEFLEVVPEAVKESVLDRVRQQSAPGGPNILGFVSAEEVKWGPSADFLAGVQILDRHFGAQDSSGA